MSDVKIDTDKLLAIVGEAAKIEYKDMLSQLDDEQRELFMDITLQLQSEYLQYAFGPEGDKHEHKANMESLKNGLAALEGIVAIKVYRTTINIVGRVLWAILKSTAKAALV